MYWELCMYVHAPANSPKKSRAWTQVHLCIGMAASSEARFRSCSYSHLCSSLQWVWGVLCAYNAFSASCSRPSLAGELLSSATLTCLFFKFSVQKIGFFSTRFLKFSMEWFSCAEDAEITQNSHLFQNSVLWKISVRVSDWTWLAVISSDNLELTRRLILHSIMIQAEYQRGDGGLRYDAALTGHITGVPKYKHYIFISGCRSLAIINFHERTVQTGW